MVGVRDRTGAVMRWLSPRMDPQEETVLILVCLSRCWTLLGQGVARPTPARGFDGLLDKYDGL